MRKTSKILSIILAILMVISIIPITANAEEPTSGTIGGVTWEFDNATGTLTFSGEGSIPSFEYSNHGGVEERPWNSFFYRYTKHIVIGDGIKHIGDYAFAEGSIIETVTIGKDVEYIGYNAFNYCDNITYVYYNGTQEEWKGIEIESYNDDLTSAKLYTSDYKVYSDSGTYGDNIIWVFDASTGTLTVSGTGVMPDDWNISEILNPVDKYEGTSRPWELYKYDIKKVVVSEGITTIGVSAFRYFPNLTEVHIASSVTKIIARAFRTSNAITDVYYSGTEEQWNNIVIGDSNDPLLNATIHYNYVECEHKFDSSFVTKPTCKHRGYTTYICSICNDSYVDDFVVVPHEYDAVVTAPTCTKQGYTTYTCSVCGYSEKDDYISSTGHDYKVSETTGPTCTANGYIKYTCANGCGSSKKEKTDSSLGHDYGTAVEIIEPTCTAKGYTKQTCERCGYVNKYDYIDALGHNDYVATSIISPTCTKQGYTIYTCPDCGEIQKDDYIDAIGHSYEWKITVEPTCTDSGIKTGICSVCGDETTETVSRLGHDWGEYQIDIAPTCTEDGQESRHCSRCDWRHSPKVIPAAHTYGEWKQVTEGACREYARFERICIACGSISIMDAPIEHKYESLVTAPTCTKQGYTTYTCECGDSYIDDFVNATGHNYTPEITIPATHTATGVETFTCVCGNSYTEVIAKLERHNYESVVTVPTCTAQGYTTYTCECGDSYIDDYVDALGHTEEIIPAVAPTCTETGLTEQKEVFVNGHTSASAVEENYVAPTCTENGSKEVVVYCSVCEKEISRETVTLEATGHADKDGNGYCDTCRELLDPTVECECNCHKSGITKFFFNFILFFQKLFGSNKTCACGVAHY